MTHTITDWFFYATGLILWLVVAYSFVFVSTIALLCKIGTALYEGTFVLARKLPWTYKIERDDKGFTGTYRMFVIATFGNIAFVITSQQAEKEQK